MPYRTWITMTFPTYVIFRYHLSLKGHGNEADFPRFLHKSVLHRSLTLHEPFRFWLLICRDIRNRKTTPLLGESGRVGESPILRLGESGSCWLSDSASRGVGYWMFFKKSPHWRVIDSPTRWVRESGSRLNQPFKGPIWQKRSQGCSVLSLLIYFKVWKQGQL